MVYNVSTNLILWRQIMLTNNKNFVRSIAMLLAMLMVMALCLTGCGNKAADDALAKAEAAQTTATEAKTAADAVNAALDDYVAKSDKETVKALVLEAIGDEFATAAEVDALAAKLADYVTAADVAKMIKDELAKYALDKLAGELMTKDDVLKLLENYYTKAEVDAKLENIWATMPAEVVKNILKDAMSLTEWNTTTDAVLETIVVDVQELVDALLTETYTQANMKKLNECLAAYDIVVFEDDLLDDDKRLDELKGDEDAVAEIAKDIEYLLLRQPTMAELKKVQDAIEAAKNVPTFESEFEALKLALYGLGDLYVVGSYNAKGEFVAEKYTADGWYHEQEVANKSETKVQIVTLADKIDFHAFADAHDALLAEYYADNTYATVDGTPNGTAHDGWIADLAAYDLYTTTTTVNKKEVTTLSTVTAGAKKPNDKAVFVATTTLNMTANADYLNKAYNGEAAENEVLLLPLYEDMVADRLAYVLGDDLTTDYKKTGTFEYVIDDLSAASHKPESGVWQDAYAMLWAQLNFVQLLADAANDVFQGGVTTIVENNPFATTDDIYNECFLEDTVYAGTSALKTKKYENVTDPEFLNALLGEMCEPATEDGDNKYTWYLIGDFDGNYDVSAIVEAFRTANGAKDDADFGGFDKGQLYDDMMAKVFDLLFNKYKSKANDWATIILKDYISVIYEAKVNAAGADNATLSGDAALNTLMYGDDKSALATAMSTQGIGMTTGELTTAEQLTDGFLKAFLQGEELGAGTVYAKLGLNKKFVESNLLAFYINNAAAYVADFELNKSTSVATAPVYASPLETINDDENLRQRLTGAAVYTSLQISGLTLEEAKAMGVSVREVFYGILKQGVADLDEVYARTLFEDYKLMSLNEMAVKAEKIVTYYNKGVANAAQTAAINRYLTGVAADGDLSGLNITKDKNSVVTNVTYKMNDLEKSVENGYLTTNYATVAVNPYAYSGPDGVDKLAGAAMAQIDKFNDEATATIENILIKANFLNYLYEARGNIVAAANDYYLYIDAQAADGYYDYDTSWDLKLKVGSIRNRADDHITVTEYFANADAEYAMSQYKEAYLTILSLIADKDNLHLALLGNSIDKIVATDLAGQEALRDKQFKEMLKKVETSQDLNWTKGPWTPYESGYIYVGSYAVDLDKLLNENGATTYKDKNNTTQNLYK